MPTGYTADIDENTTFQAFALKCARAFGALITMRDDPTDAPIPDSFAPSTYEARRVAECEERVAMLSSMTDAEKVDAAEAAHETAVKQRAEWRAKAAAERVNYERILGQARAWEPPTPDHAGLRDFMIQQLTETIRFDCSTDWIKDEPRLSGVDWWKSEHARAVEALKYAHDSWREEQERTRTRNDWVKALRESLAAALPEGKGR